MKPDLGPFYRQALAWPDFSRAGLGLACDFTRPAFRLIEWCKNPDEYVTSLAMKMRRKFDVYWEKCNLGLAVAPMLDPRFKMKLMEYYYTQLYGCSASELIDDVLNCIKTLYSEHSIGSPLATPIDNQGLASWQLSDDRLMGFDKFIDETCQGGQGSKTDLDKYLEETLFPRNIVDNFDVLNWWKINGPRYPILSIMARNILSIPMSKVESESRRRVLDHDPRSSLQHPPTLVQALIFTQQGRI
ncbi:hypothetical protein Q3G72_024437 [Acer saccharum]|nr:hypothetical protein Q3G72_024437 [Acer saccharum]